MKTKERLCKNCGCLPLNDAPICVAYGYPMEVDEDFSCEKWHPRLDFDVEVLEATASLATKGGWEIVREEDALFINSASGTVAQIVSNNTHFHVRFMEMANPKNVMALVNAFDWMMRQSEERGAMMNWLARKLAKNSVDAIELLKEAREAVKNGKGA